MASFEDHRLSVADGLSLHVRIHGASHGGVPVVCLPGLTRNLLDFHPLAEILSSGPHARRVISISSRGRGLSDRDPEPARYTIPVEAADVIAVLDQLAIDRAAFIGTSRGGLILHVLAMTHLARLERVVLNDIGPVLDTEGLKQIQSYLGKRAAPTSLADARAALEDLHGAEFPALTGADWEAMASALYRDVDGQILADFDPAIADQFRAADLSAPLPALWPQYELLAQKPLMVVRGEHSRLLSGETVAEMKARKPDLITAEAKGQGHAPLLHLHGLDAAIAAFLAEPV